MKQIPKHVVTSEPSPLGLSWDDANWSCAYDSVLTIFAYIWSTGPELWTEAFEKFPLMVILTTGLSEGQSSLEETRDDIRVHLNDAAPNTFPYGPFGAPAAELANKLLQTESAFYNSIRSSKCSCNPPQVKKYQQSLLLAPSEYEYHTT